MRFITLLAILLTQLLFCELALAQSASSRPVHTVLQTVDVGNTGRQAPLERVALAPGAGESAHTHPSETLSEKSATAFYTGQVTTGGLT
jgi:hypothetical protein